MSENIYAEKDKKETEKKPLSGLFEFISSLGTALIIIVIVFMFVIRPVGVSGSSMVPTLHDGDYLFIETMKHHYSYKDVVIVVQPNSLNEPIVKRVIATEGQWVYVNYDDGHVYVGNTKDNLIKLDEPYTNELTTNRGYDDKNDYPIQVPEGMLFCMGDNRNHSTDSRSELVGFINEKYVLGKAVFRLIPFGHFNIYESSESVTGVSPEPASNYVFLRSSF